MISPIQCLRVLLCLSTLSTATTATEFLPRGNYGELHRGAFEELHNVIIHPRGERNLYIRGAVPHPRTARKGNRSAKRNVDTSPRRDIRRILLGERQSCDPGYSLCQSSGRCCPNTNNNGRCCDDGTCTNGSDTCCVNGGACPSGQDCCENGCKPKQNQCCTGDWNCDPGTTCCGDDNCKPNGGECCENRTSCDKGLHCVTLNGLQGCCKDLTCSEFDSSSNDDSSGAPSGAPSAAASASFPSISIPAINTGDLTAFPSISIPSITDTFLGTDFGYYTTTFTFTFYTFFITTVQTEFVTSTLTATTTTFSVYASDSADATSQFVEFSSGFATLTAISAPGLTGLPTATRGSRSAIAIGGGPTATAASGGSGSGSGGSSGGASGGGQASAASTLHTGTGLLMCFWVVLAASIGAGMVFL